MKQFFNLVLAATCAAALLGGCTGKNGDPGPTGATGATGSTGPAGTPGTSGQNLTGSIVGYVNPIDDSGAALNKNGVVVSIDGSNPAITATTNTDGRYEFTNVRNGTYNLTFTRSGLATFRRFSVGHVGGDQPTYLGNITLPQVSPIAITNFTATAAPNATVPSNGFVSVGFVLTSPTPTTLFRYAVVASTSSTITVANAVLLFTGATSTSFATTSTTLSTTISRTTLINAGFASGTTVYLTAFGSTANLFSYSDPSTGRLVYPTLNTTSPTGIMITVP